MIKTKEETLQGLRAEKQYTIRIKPDSKQPNYVTERVIVNGVDYLIEVGKTVEVPETIYNVLLKKNII